MVERGVWGLAARTEVEMADGSRVEVVQRVGQTGWDAVGIALGGDKSGRVSRQARDELMSQELEDMLTRGGLGDRPPAVGAEFEWARLPDALEHLKSGKSVGKVVVTVDS